MGRDTMQHTNLKDVDGLAKDLARLEEDRESSDMVFVVGREGAKVTGHAAIFNVRCSSFVDLVSNRSETHQPGVITVNLTFLNSEAFIKFVKFVYSGEFDVRSVNVFEVMAISSLFGVDSLTNWCSNHVRNSLSLTSAQQYLNDAAAIPDEVPKKTSLVRPAVQYVGENINSLRERRLLERLSKDALVMLVRSQYLCLNSTEAWRFCLSWAKNSVGLESSSDASTWSDEERSSVRCALDGVVQHLRMIQIDPTVYAEEVEPTGAIPLELMLEKYRHAACGDKAQRDQRLRQDDRLGPGDGQPRTGRGQRREDHVGGGIHRARHDRSGGRPLSRPRDEPDIGRLSLRGENGSSSRGGAPLVQDSNILKNIENAVPNCSAILSSWYGNPHQCWKLVFRASEHQFQASSFHGHCDGAGPSFILVESDTGYR